MSAGKQDSSTYKILIVGEPNVGKTSMTSRFVDDTFSTKFMATIGADFKTKTIEQSGKEIKLQLWDTQGVERFRDIDEDFYEECDGVIIAYDSTDRSALRRTEQLLDDVRRYAPKNVKLMLAATKIDRPESASGIPHEDAKKFADDYGMTFIQCSAKENINITEAFTTLASDITASRFVDPIMKEAIEEVRLDNDSALQRLLSQGLDPRANSNILITLALENDNPDIIKTLLEWRGADGAKIDATWDDNALIKWACSGNHTEIVRMLLEWEGPDGKRVDPATNTSQTIRWACAAGYTDIVQLLLDDGRADPAAINNYAIMYSCENGKTDIVRLLLDDDRVDPTAFDNQAIKKSCENGHVDITKMLLEWEGPDGERVDPAAYDSQTLRWACSYGHTDIIRILLEDGRADPTAIDNYAIKKSCEKGHTDIVALLLADGRVDPTYNNHEAVVLACTNNNINALKLLINDPRVQIKEIANLITEKEGRKITIRKFIEESGDRELVAKLNESKRVVEERLPSGRIVTKPIIPEHFVENIDKIIAIQKRFAGKFARKKVTEFTKIPLETPASPTVAVESTVQSTYQRFYKEASDSPYYLKHAFMSDEKYKLIMQSGAFLAQHKVESIIGIASSGLNNDFDRANASHYFSYFGTGAKKDALPTPTGLDGLDAGYFIIDIDLWEKTAPSQAKNLVVKGEDWGARKKKVINIPGSSANIRVAYSNFASSKGGHSKHSSQTYTYKNPDSSNPLVRAGITYTFPISEEVSVGGDYHRLVPDLIAKHMAHLPPEEHAVVLRSLTNAANEEEFQAATKGLINVFYNLEASIGGSLPLQLEYVDSIKRPGFSEPVVSLAPLREAVEQGDTVSAMHFFMRNASLCSASWITESVYRIASKNGHEAIVGWIAPTYEKIIADRNASLHIVPESITQINQHLKPIIFGGSDTNNDVLIKKSSDGSCRQIEFSGLSNPEKTKLCQILSDWNIEYSRESDSLLIKVEDDGRHEAKLVRNTLLAHSLKEVFGVESLVARVNDSNNIEIMTYNERDKQKIATALQTMLPDSADKISVGADLITINEPSGKILTKVKNLANKDVLHEENLEYVRSLSGGAHDCRLYRDKITGDEWVIKLVNETSRAKDEYVYNISSDPSELESITRNEVLTGKLYELFGVPVPEMKTAKFGNQLFVASKYDPSIGESLSDGGETNKQRITSGDHSIEGLYENFIFDAIFAQNDIIGRDYDNIVITDNVAKRVDLGGALLRKGGGAKKEGSIAYTPHNVNEIDLYRIRGDKYYKELADVFSSVSDDDIKQGLRRLINVSDDAIREIVMQHGPGTTKEKTELADTILNRINIVKERYKGYIIEIERSNLENNTIVTTKGNVEKITIDSPIEDIAKLIGERYYLRPFTADLTDGAIEPNLSNSGHMRSGNMERLIHGQQNACRVAALIPVLFDFYKANKELLPEHLRQEIENFTPEQMKLLQISALMRAAGRYENNPHNRDGHPDLSSGKYHTKQGVAECNRMLESLCEGNPRFSALPLNEFAQAIEDIDVDSGKGLSGGHIIGNLLSDATILETLRDNLGKTVKSSWFDFMKLMDESPSTPESQEIAVNNFEKLVHEHMGIIYSHQGWMMANYETHDHKLISVGKPIGGIGGGIEAVSPDLLAQQTRVEFANDCFGLVSHDINSLFAINQKTQQEQVTLLKIKLEEKHPGVFKDINITNENGTSKITIDITEGKYNQAKLIIKEFAPGATMTKDKENSKITLDGVSPLQLLESLQARGRGAASSTVRS